MPAKLPFRPIVTVIMGFPGAAGVDTLEIEDEPDVGEEGELPQELDFPTPPPL